MSNETDAPSSATQELVAEQNIQQELEKAFPDLTGKFTLQRARRIWVEIPMDTLLSVVAYAKDELGFGMLCTITGTDEGEHLGLMYHLASDEGVVLTLVVAAPKDGPGPQTVTPHFPHADLYEREVVDLLGARIQGLPEGNRYPLPDGWPEGQFPLRKDWTREMLEVAKENT
jgi:membrane-bound hydrogenase subunit beta